MRSLLEWILRQLAPRDLDKLAAGETADVGHGNLSIRGNTYRYRILVTREPRP